jgi:hypothetical protein
MSGRIVFGFGLGLGAIVVAPYVVPVITAVGRPLVKGAVKAALLGIDRARLGVARFAETLEDMVAEVRSEVADDRATMRGESVELSVASSSGASSKSPGSGNHAHAK